MFMRMHKNTPLTLHDRIIAGISILYIVSVCAYMIAHRIWFSPDQFFIFALLGAFFIGQARLFLLDWLPFLTLFLGYEFLRGLVPFVSKNPHILPMIRIDQAIFGFIPTIKLQSLFYTPASLHWYDYVLVTFYISHFVTPMVVGFIFWLKDRAFFKNYTLALLLLSYVSFFTYLIFPAAPPWMASSRGYLPPIEEVTGHVMSHFLPTQISLPSVYSFMRPNPVAAMPSLHAAFPLLITLFVFKKFKKFGLLLVPYVLGVWFAVIYLGEHYFIDVAVGALYAVLTFLFINYKSYLWQKFRAFFTKPRILPGPAVSEAD